MEFNKEQIRAIFITGILILAIILTFLIVSIIRISNDNNKRSVDVAGNYASIKELVEHHESKYIDDTYVENREYPTEVELVFKYQLYDDEKSNEEFFESIIEDLAKFLQYKSYKMIDKENDITIEVVCERGNISRIIINDIEDYFIYMDSQLEYTQYEEIKTTNLTTQVEALNFLIENKWSKDVNFGIRESIFKNYNIHFDEGIRYRKIGSNIYNVIFTEKYPDPVVNNIRVGIDLKSIKDSLGTPAFEDKDLGLIGYKGKDIYAFFTKDEISIYQNRAYDYDSFWKLVDKFVDEDSQMDFKQFMNELTYIWKDYSEYTYAEDYMFMAYPNKGVEIKLNYDNISGIVLYNNISEDLKVVEKYLKNTEFVSRLKLDSVFEAEKRRVNSEKAFKEECSNLEKEEETKSMLFYSYIEKDNIGMPMKVLFVSKNGEHPNRELIEVVDTYRWISDEHFIYSIEEQGIYCFNAISGEKVVITEEGTGPFKIEDFQNGVLTYDSKEIVLEF